MDNSTDKKDNRFASFAKRLGIYILGLLLIAVGVNISKLSGLGISPASSVPRACEVAWGFTLGTTIIIVYCILVLLQFIVLRKDFRWTNALGVLVGVVFGWLVDLTGVDPKAFGHLMVNFPRPESYINRLLYLALSIIIIGAGVYLYLKPQLVPMPAEGLAAAIAKKCGKNFGDCKTIVDTSLITIAILIQLIFLGGFRSFLSEPVIVREGTVISALLVGQVVKYFKKLEAQK